MTQDTLQDNNPTEAAPVDFGSGFRFGSDPQGASVDLSLALSSMLIGGAPRTGATSTARLVALAAALDPKVRLYVFDGKGGRDWQPFEPVAHRFGSGVRRSAVEEFAACLDGLVDELHARYETLRELPDDLRPEGRLTPAIARNQTLAMPLVLVCIDEVDPYLAHPELGDPIAERLVKLTRVGPAAGVTLVATTHWPWEVPLRLRDAMAVRFALQTATWQESETILGAGTRARGLDASTLPWGKGTGILRDDAGARRIVRTDFFDLACLRRIAERGRQLRIEAGTLTGAAVGEEG